MVLATRIFLELRGYEILEAYDGVQALDVLSDATPDLVILDVMMPRMDGWAALRAIRADERFKGLPVMMLTALNDPRSIVTGLDLDATWYYTKPVTDWADFGLVVGRILEGLEPPAGPLEDW
jgi:DNA-binding response OmpR family regulator